MECDACAMISKGKREPLMIIEDDYHVAEIEKGMIERFCPDYISDVIIVDNATKALEIVKRGTSVKFFFVDLLLPGMDGKEFCLVTRDFLTLHSNHPSFIFVAVTGGFTSYTLSDLRRSGFDDILLKPIDRNQLISVVVCNVCRIQRWKTLI